MITTARASAACVRSFRLFRLREAGLLVARWYDRRLQRSDLAELDDRLLADIGKTPEEARREYSKPFWRT